MGVVSDVLHFDFKETRPTERNARSRFFVEARPKERSDRGLFLLLGKKTVHSEAFFAFRQKSLFMPGCVRGAVI